jgi:hypothetical protein
VGNDVGVFARNGVGVLAVFFWGIGAHAQTVPADPARFAKYFAHVLAVGLPDDNVTVQDDGTVTLTAADGSHIDLDTEAVGHVCAEPKADFQSCSDSEIKAAIGLFAPGKSGEFRAQLAFDAGGMWNAPFNRKAVVWGRASFGTFDEECYKNAPAFLYPTNAWDGMLRHLDKDGIGALCERDTRAALGPLESRLGVPDVDGVATISGRFEASRALFVDVWKPLADKLGGLLIALPETSTVLYAKDAPGMAELLSKRALAVRKGHAISHDSLSIDVYRWSAAGWRLVTSHAMADEVAAALSQAIPGADVVVEDAYTIAVGGGRNGPSDVNIERLAQDCPVQNAQCDDRAAALAAHLVSVLGGGAR